MNNLLNNANPVTTLTNDYSAPPMICFSQETQNFCVEITDPGNLLPLRCINISFISSLIWENCCITLMIHINSTSCKGLKSDNFCGWKHVCIFVSLSYLREKTATSRLFCPSEQEPSVVRAAVGDELEDNLVAGAGDGRWWWRGGAAVGANHVSRLTSLDNF